MHLPKRERQQAHEYKTPDVVFYLISVQFISRNESSISIIQYKEIQGLQ